MGKYKSNHKKESILIYGTALGAAFGASFGAIFESVGVSYGISIGIILGVIIALLFGNQIVRFFGDPDKTDSNED